MKRAQDWDTGPLDEPKPRRPLQYLPLAVAIGLIAGLVIAQGVHGGDRIAYDRLMSGLGASGVEAVVTPTDASSS